VNADQELGERMAILELTARYADTADHKDWKALTSMYTPNGVFEGGSVYGRAWRGQEEILDFYEHAPLATGHHPTGVYTVFDGDDRALTRLKMLVLFKSAIFTVDYVLQLAKVSGDWKIAHLEIAVVGRTDLPR